MTATTMSLELTPAMSDPTQAAGAFVEALATIYAASGVVNQLAGPDTGIFFAEAAEELKKLVFGASPETDEEFDTCPRRT